MNRLLPQRRRVVITGMGVIAPNGCDLEPFWDSIVNGRSAGGTLERFDTGEMPVKIAAEIKNFDGKNFMPLKKAKRLDISTQYGIAAARLAFEDSKLNAAAMDADRVGVVEGISLGGTETTLKGGDALLKKDYRHINAFSLVNGYTGAGAGEIALELGLRGFAASYCAGSASGNEAIGHAMRMIVDDEVDVMVAGGSEAPFLPELWAVFCLNRVMSGHNGSPTQAMKPFDVNRDGFLLGEGSAFLVLEELTHALARGANIYAELAGHGRYCEAFHSVNPHPEGLGVIRALERAARHAGLAVTDIQYINAHGTATAANDVAESRAFRTLFERGTAFPAVSSTKPVTGHLLGASGALETVVCALAISTQTVPFTLNCRDIDPECDIEVVRGAAVAGERCGESEFGLWRQERLPHPQAVSVWIMQFSQSIPITAAVVNALLTLFVLTRNLKGQVNRVFALWGGSLVVWNFGTYMMFQVETREQAIFWARFVQCGVIWLPVTLAHLCLMIAQVQAFDRLIGWSYAYCAALMISNLTAFFISDVLNVGYAWYSVAGLGFWLFTPMYTLSLLAIAVLFHKRGQVAPLHRTRLTYMTLAMAMMIVFGINDTLPILGIYQYPFTGTQILPFGSMAAIFFGLIVGYSVLQHQLLGVHVVLGRISAHALRIGFLLLGGFSMLLLISALAPKGTFSSFALWASLVAYGCSTLVASFFFPQIFSKGEDDLVRRILGDRFEYHDRVRSVTKTLMSAETTSELWEEIEALFLRTIRVRLLCGYWRVLETEEFRPALNYPDGVMPTEIPAASPLAASFAGGENDYLTFNIAYSPPGQRNYEKEAMELFQRSGAEFCFPLRAGNTLVGLIFLGAKSDAEPYTRYDVNLFMELFQELARALNHLQLRQQLLAREEMELMGRMSRGLAHDLNNLVTPVSTFLQLLQEQNGRADGLEELIPVANRNIQAIRAYIREALLLSNTNSINLAQGNLDSIIRTSIEIAETKLRTREMSITYEGEPLADMQLDAVLIQRVFDNLISNAIDASPNGSSLEIHLRRLTRMRAGSQWYRIEVTDHGHGISRENLKRVFTPYFTTKDKGDKTRGFGLGLAICRRIVHLHHGQMSLRSEEGKGTTIVVELPTAAPVQAQPRAGTFEVAA